MGRRDTLVYRILPSSSGVPPQTRVLFGRLTVDEDDHQCLARFSRAFLGLDRDASFDALHQKLPLLWNAEGTYDIASPFGDRRQCHLKAMWVFDLDRDLLLHTDSKSRSQIPLALLRKRCITMADMQPLGPTLPPPVKPTIDLQLSPWKPTMAVDGRLRAITHRMLRDFDHQWRHILRNHYNSLTRRVLARGIIRLATLNFKILEETRPRNGPSSRSYISDSGPYVSPTELPAWEPLEADIARVGKTHAVLCESMQEGLSKARRHAESRHPTLASSSDDSSKSGPQVVYMILSIKYVMLCHLDSSNVLKHTAPEALLNGGHGNSIPSELALNYLLWATSTTCNPIQSLMPSLPVEIQDNILRYVAGPLKAAKIGCLLEIGSPFRWKDGEMNIELEEYYRHRSPVAPVESQIWFDRVRAGLVYRGQQRFPTSFPRTNFYKHSIESDLRL